MELRIHFINSISCVLIFLLTPIKGNYEVQTALKVKDLDLAYGEKLSSVEETSSKKKDYKQEKHNKMEINYQQLPGVSYQVDHKGIAKSNDRNNAKGRIMPGSYNGNKIWPKSDNENKISLAEYLKKNQGEFKGEMKSAKQQEDESKMAVADQEVKSEIAEGEQELKSEMAEGDLEVKSAKEKSDDESLEGKKTHTTAKVTRITKCTTSSPLPKLSDGFFPYEYYDNNTVDKSSAEEKTTTVRDVTKEYLKPTDGPIPKLYIDDE